MSVMAMKQAHPPGSIVRAAVSIAAAEGRRRGRPAIVAKEPRGRSLAEQLCDIERVVMELAGSRIQDAALRMAMRKFRSSGETAVVMSTADVGLVLNIVPKHVNNMVGQKLLVRRFGKAGFHPDDVRAYLASAKR